jgi:Ca2+/H+ antiporter
MSGELRKDANTQQLASSDFNLSSGAPSNSELAFCRVNAVIMMTMYVCYLLFQVGTHKEEFDEAGTSRGTNVVENCPLSIGLTH